jgi:hypothetical protein
MTLGSATYMSEASLKNMTLDIPKGGAFTKATAD